MNYNLRYPIHKFISLISKSKKRVKDMIYKDNRLNDLKLIDDNTLDLALNDVLNQIKAINEYLFDDKESDLRKIYNIEKDKKI